MFENELKLIKGNLAIFGEEFDGYQLQLNGIQQTLSMEENFGDLEAFNL